MGANSRRGVGVVSVGDPLVSLDFGGWLKRVYGVFRFRFAPLAALALLPAVVQVMFLCAMDVVRLTPAEAARRLAAAGPVDGLTAAGIVGLPTLPVVAIFIGPLVVATAFFLVGGYCLVVCRSNGQPLGPAGALRMAAPRVPRFVLCMLGFWLGCAVAFYLLVLPGTLLGSELVQGVGMVLGGVLLLAFGVVFFASFCGVMVIERVGLVRCFRLVRGRLWVTVGRMAMTGLIYYGYTYALALVTRWLTAPFGGPPTAPGLGSVVFHVVAQSLTIPLSVFLAAATLVSYAELRCREDRLTSTRTLAAELFR
jgi:hypothetical protein